MKHRSRLSLPGRIEIKALQKVSIRLENGFQPGNFNGLCLSPCRWLPMAEFVCAAGGAVCLRSVL
jgi:hypothetical protein